MIKIVYNNKRIVVTGHANYDSYGKDIVCASVSSIIYTTINGILNINSKALTFKDNEALEINILSNDDITLKLINNMFELLKGLEKQYPNNLKLSKGE